MIFEMNGKVFPKSIVHSYKVSPLHTNSVCPRTLDPFCIAGYNIVNWVKTSWTYSIHRACNKTFKLEGPGLQRLEDALIVLIESLQEYL